MTVSSDNFYLCTRAVFRSWSMSSLRLWTNQSTVYVNLEHVAVRCTHEFAVTWILSFYNRLQQVRAFLSCDYKSGETSSGRWCAHNAETDIWDLVMATTVLPPLCLGRDVLASNAAFRSSVSRTVPAPCRQRRLARRLCRGWHWALHRPPLRPAATTHMPLAQAGSRIWIQNPGSDPRSPCALFAFFNHTSSSHTTHTGSILPTNSFNENVDLNLDGSLHVVPVAIDGHNAVCGVIQVGLVRLGSSE